MALPLKGIQILDTAHHYPGPYCTMLLSDLGAEVLKVEPPGLGDPARQFPSFFNSLNRNKKSLSLNLKSEVGRSVFCELARKYDVVIEGFRPGVAQRLGIDYQTLKKNNPGLIYCSISGYGQDGPYRDLPGHDLNYLGMAGVLREFKDESGKLTTPTLPMGDLSSGMFAAIGILSALTARNNAGKGQYIDISMFDGLISWMGTQIGTHYAKGRTGEDLDAGYGIFYGSDDLGFTLGIAYEDKFWKALCAIAGLKDIQNLNAPERRTQREPLRGKLQAVFSTKSRKEWIVALAAADIPVTPVQTVDDLIRDPHIAFRGLLQTIPLRSGKTTMQVTSPIKFGESRAGIPTPPPALGENNGDVLRTLGYSEVEIKEFKNNGIV